MSVALSVRFPLLVSTEPTNDVADDGRLATRPDLGADAGLELRAVDGRDLGE